MAALFLVGVGITGHLFQKLSARTLSILVLVLTRFSNEIFQTEVPTWSAGTPVFLPWMLTQPVDDSI